MTCDVCGEKTKAQFCSVHQQMLDDGWTINGWQKYEGEYYKILTKKLDAQDKRLNETIRTGRAHGRNVNNLRSYYKNGKWQYKYLK